MGKLRRKAYKTNRACWYCKNLKEGGTRFLKVNPELRFEFYKFSETVQWIREIQDKFPWILKKKEIHTSDIYNHYYSNLKTDGELIGFIKIGIDHVYVEDYESEISLADDEVFIYDTFILPEYRKRYLGSIMLQCALNELERIGVSYVFCHIPGWNEASIRLYRSLGFRPVVHVRYLRLLRFRFFSKNLDKVREKGRGLVAKY